LTRPVLESNAIEYDKIDFADVLVADMQAKIQAKSSGCTVIKWGDLDIEDLKLNKLIINRFAWKIENSVTAGSLDYEKSNLAAMNLIGKQKGSDPILILVESWEAPDAALKFFLKQLRETIPVDRHIIIGLINKNSYEKWNPPLKSDRQIWKREIAGLTDPYLRVESVVE